MKLKLPTQMFKLTMLEIDTIKPLIGQRISFLKDLLADQPKGNEHLREEFDLLTIMLDDMERYSEDVENVA